MWLIFFPSIIYSESLQLQGDVLKILESVLINNRIGIEENISKVVNPFGTSAQQEAEYIDSDDTEMIQSVDRLEMIINLNAKIGEHWYKEGEYFKDNKIKKITTKCLIFEGDEEDMCLKSNNKNFTLKIDEITK